MISLFASSSSLPQGTRHYAYARFFWFWASAFGDRTRP
jgi:hypothetical protein